MGCCSSSQPVPEPEPTPQEIPACSPEIQERRSSVLKQYQHRDNKQTSDVESPEIKEEPKEEKKPDVPTISVEPEEMEVIKSMSTIVASFSRLHDVFHSHADKSTKKMDKEGLTEALKVFGLKVDVNKHVHDTVWSKFSLDGADEIDYDDFSATISILIDTENEEFMFLLFQIFDYDESGYLEMKELGEMLFAQQLLAATVTNQPELITDRTNKICLKSAERFVQENDDNGDGKISFDEYHAYRKKHEVVVQVGTPRV
eukprot:137480_1